MAIVDGIESLKVRERIRAELDNEMNQEELEKYLIESGHGTLVFPDMYFPDKKKKLRRGFCLNTNLKNNIENYLIKAVEASWDGNVLCTGMEGSGKSTTIFALAKFCDPTFPSDKLLHDGSGRRHVDRIVFTQKQFEEAVMNSKPRQAIVWDEMVLGGLAQDAATDAQKSLIKLMTTIRKKRLYLFFVIPSIFMLRMYFAVFRSRALIHFYTPDGIQRGFFKFYSYDAKRRVYILGKKDFNMDASNPDFNGQVSDTTGFFFDDEEYQKKKDDAIASITEEQEKKKETKGAKVYKEQRDILMFYLYNDYKRKDPNMSWVEFVNKVTKNFGDKLKYTPQMAKKSVVGGITALGLDDVVKLT
jgi:hypothetical protein